LLACIASVAIAWRMDVVDHEGHPIHITPRIFGYWLWLGREIVKWNIDVALHVLSPRLRISPTLVRLKASQQTELCQAIYANSITLTPGTVTIDLKDGSLLVHALSEEAAIDLLQGEMDARVVRVER
jgi:multicomponent Na+:H+ antiporter subunit E